MKCLLALFVATVVLLTGCDAFPDPMQQANQTCAEHGGIKDSRGYPYRVTCGDGIMRDTGY